MNETKEYVLQTVILKNIDTDGTYWPVMMVTTPNGYYVDIRYFTQDESDHIRVKLGTNYCTLYKVHDRYEPIKTVDFGAVEIVEEE